jgi:SAM-dependent methyltransferase
MTEGNAEDLWGYSKRLRFIDDSIRAGCDRTAREAVHVLDIGCGNGSQLTIPLAALGYQVTGIDTHPASIEAARRFARPNLHFYCGSVDDIPSAPFDVVILSEVLEHVADPDKLLHQAVEKLSVSGVMIVTVPNGYGEFEWDSWLYRTFGIERLVASYEIRQRSANPDRPALSSSTENLDDRHVNFFTLARLRQMFDAEGLQVMRENPSTLLAGPLVGHTLARSKRFVSWNARVADRVPMALASGWYFALTRMEKHPR